MTLGQKRLSTTGLEEIFRVRDQLLATGKYGDGSAVLDAAARIAFNNRAASSVTSSAYVISRFQIIYIKIVSFSRDI